MLSAQDCYGVRVARTSQEQITMGRNLFPSLPEDSFDRGPEQLGPLLLVADVRLDNRDEMASALGLAQHTLPQMCDAHLLMHALAKWEEDAVQKIVGEFAFALWNKSDRSLLLARDYIGMRPLHFHVNGELCAFASMPSGLHAVPGIRKELNYEFIAEQLALVPQRGDECYYRNVSRVPSGHLVRITRNGITQSAFWKPPEPGGRRSGDIEEGLRAVVDRAVRSQLRGLSADIATHLSGGLDSSIVTATAAKLNKPAKVIAFTAAPSPSFKGPVPTGMNADERSLASTVAEHYPNIEHVVIEASTTPLSGMAAECAHAQEPPVNLCNGVWLHAIYKSARERGLRTLLMGSAGNISISYSGADVLPYLLSRRKLTELGSLGLQLVRNGMPPTSLIWQTIGAYLPAPIWRTLARIRRRPTDLPSYSAVNMRVLPALRRRAEERGLDFLFRPRRDPLEARAWMLSRFDGGNNVKSVLARWGISVRDPTADRRVVEYCFSLPYETYVESGVYRSLARRAFSDRVPQEVLSNVVRGYQAPDWYEGLEADLPRISELIDAIDGTNACQALDLDWMRETVRTWPTSGWERADVAMRYRAGLLRAVAAAHFMHSVQSER